MTSLLVGDCGAFTHIYLGDKLTREELRGRLCRPVHRADGKCIRGRNGNMHVEWEDGSRDVVAGRRLHRLRGNP